jgi:hypothetical protein
VREDECVEESFKTERTVVVDEMLIKRMTSAFFWYGLSRPLTVTTFALLLLASVTWGWFVRPIDGGPIAWTLAGLLLGIPAFSIGLPVRFFAVRRRFRAIVFPGATYTVRASDETIMIQSPHATSETAYRAFQSVIERRGFVFLRYRSSRIYVVLPAELFADGLVSVVRSRILSAAEAR